MGKKKCDNCEQIIGNLEEYFIIYKNRIVCKACKILLKEESQAIGATNSNVENEILNTDILPQKDADTKHRDIAEIAQQDEQGKNYGGIHRTGYFIGMLAIAIVKVISMTAAKSEYSEPGASFGLVVVLTFSFFIVISRLKNIGMNGWWSLLILVPFANLYIGVKCAICPEGYQDTKKLDTAGKIIVSILVAFIALIVVSVTIAVLNS